MRILALITARGRSVRVPGKNIRPLGGRPLIVWSIERAGVVPEVCDILVSTDDESIAEVARRAGALVPWLRPAELATDTTSSVDTALHALEWYERQRDSIDGLLLLQPTTPFRSDASVRRGVDLFVRGNRRPVVGVSPAETHPMMCFYLENGSMRPFVEGAATHRRSQDLPPAFVVNGGFYLVQPRHLREQRSFYADDMVPLVMDGPEEAIDIDTEADWLRAEALVPSLTAPRYAP